MRSGHTLVIVLLTIGATACDHSTPTQATMPDVSGTWEGSYQITACVAAETCVPSPCRFILGQRSILRLALDQVRSRINGRLEILVGDPFFVWAGEVSGAVDASGGLGLSGTIPQVDRESGRMGRYFDVSWTTTVDGTGASMSGGFSYLTRNATGTGCMTRETATIASLARLP